MKHGFVFATLLTLPGLAALPASAAATQGPKDAYVLRVDGLACPYCAYGIEKQFSRMQGVTSTDINIAKGVVIVYVKPGTYYTAQALATAVSNAGFTLKAIVSKPTATEP